jgi:hypothetical protein
VSIRTISARAAIAAVACGFMATAAEAKIMNVVYTGTVHGTYDSTGVFGTTPWALEGKDFTARFTYDTTLGNRFGNAESDNVEGGTGAYSGGASPITHASLTINGITQAFKSDRLGSAGVANRTGSVGTPLGGISEVAESLLEAGGVEYGSSLLLGLFNGSAPTSLDTPFSGAPSGLYAGQASGGFYLYAFDIDLQELTVDTRGEFTTAHVSITEAVPEPSSWAVMMLGFGGVGATLRRRKVAMFQIA